MPTYTSTHAARPRTTRRTTPRARRDVLVVPRVVEVVLARFVKWKSYKAYLSSMVWMSKRERALRRANYRCQTCPNTRGLHVHHADSDYKFEWGSEDDTRLTVLCSVCHKRIHGIK